jgi:hypothetical protein
MENFDLKKYLANNPLLTENFILRLKNYQDEKLNTDIKINSKPTSLFGNDNEGWDVEDLQDIFKKAGLTVSGETELELIDSSGKVIKTGRVFGYDENRLPIITPAPQSFKSYEENPRHPKNIQNKIQQYIKDGFKGDLYLPNYPITSLPDDFKVGGVLDLGNTKITSLPDNLQVGKNLFLNNTKITSLPNNLQVGGDLDLQNTSVTSLPNDLKVGGDLKLQNTLFSKKYTEEEIRQMVPGVKGTIKVKN